MERTLKGVFMIAIHLERGVLRRTISKQLDLLHMPSVRAELIHSLVVESTSHVIQEVNVFSLLAARVN